MAYDVSKLKKKKKDSQAESTLGVLSYLQDETPSGDEVAETAKKKKKKKQGEMAKKSHLKGKTP